MTDHCEVALGQGRVIYRHHLFHDYVFDEPVAEVVAHPQRPGLWGLKNLTDTPWRAALPEAGDHEVDPGRSLRLIRGTVVDLGSVSAMCR